MLNAKEVGLKLAIKISGISAQLWKKLFFLRAKEIS